MTKKTDDIDDDLKAMLDAAEAVDERGADEAISSDNEQLSEAEERAKLSKTLDELADEDSEEGVNISFKTFLRGDILSSPIVKRQVLFVVFCAGLMIFHTWVRYSGQDDAILIDNLNKELEKCKYNVLTQSSELLNYMRQSNVERSIKHSPDSMLSSSVSAPFLLKSTSSKYDVEEDVESKDGEEGDVQQQ